MPVGLVSSTVQIPANADVALLARVRAQAFNFVTTAVVNSITWTLTDLTPTASPTTPTIVSSGTGVVANVIFNALVQTDPSWTRDGPPVVAPETGYVPAGTIIGSDGTWGYNFKLIIPAVSIPITTSGHRVHVDVVLTFTTGETLRLAFEWQVSPTYA
jgi:hypothetical protein